MEKKKVLFVTWSLTQGGGEAQSVINILNNLNYDKYDVYVFEFNRGLKEISLNSEIKFLKPIVDYNKENNDDEKRSLTRYMRNPESIRKLIDDKYDCVIACNRGTTSAIAAFIKANKRIVWIRGTIENLNVNNYASTSEKELVKYKYDQQNILFNAYDKIVAVSDSVENSLITMFDKHKNKVVKIYNSIDPVLVKKMSEEDFTLYQPTKPNVLINVGRLREVKNQQLIIKAMKIITKKRKDVELLIIGEGLLKDELEKEIKDNKLEEYVKLIGFCSNPFPLLKKAKIFCLSSHSEGFCLSISEACTLEIPFVSTDVGGAQELKKDECGFIVDGKPESFAEKIEFLLNNSKVYEKTKSNCLVAAKRFDVKNLGVQVGNLIDSMFENGGD